MRKRKRDWPIKCYKYGLMINEGIPETWWQEHATWCDTWNRLVEENKKLSEEYQAIFNENEKIAILKQKISNLLDIYQTEKGENKKQDAARLTEIKDFHSQIKELKIEFKEKFELKFDEHKTKTIEIVDKIVGESELYWTHKAYLRDSWWQAVTKSGYQGPHFKSKFKKDICFLHKYTGGGAEFSSIFRQNKRFWIESVDWSKVDISQPQRQWKKLVRTKVHFFMCGEEMVFSCVLHRPIPENAIIKGITLTMRRCGHDTPTPRSRTAKTTRWEMCVTFEIPEEIDFRKRESDCLTFLELGWRRLNDDLRVGVWQQEFCKSVDILLPQSIVESISKSIGEQQKKDEQLNLLREYFSAIISPVSGIGAYMKAYRDMSNDEEKMKIKILIDAWKYNCYLIAAASRKASLARKHFYYNLAHKICSVSKDIVIKDIKIKALSQPKKDKERGKEITVAQRLAQKYRSLAAIGEFKEILTKVSKKYGSNIVTLESKNMTLLHNNCGHIQVDMSAEERQNRFITCQKCGEIYEQDLNAIKNMRDMFYTKFKN